jgi:hypothetical protein
VTRGRPARLAWSAALAVALAAAEAAAGGLEPEAAPSARGSAAPAAEAPLEAPAFGAARAAARATQDGVALVLLAADGRVVGRLPDPPGAGEWTFWAADLAAADLDGDGAADLVAVVEYVTGIGPDGARPFPLAAVYLQRPEGFTRDPDREAAANEGALAGAWSGAADLAARLRGGGG